MKLVALLFIFILQSEANSFELQPGDVLLISFNCYECRVIESETNSPYSHSGVVLKAEDNSVLVAQSIGFVKTYSLESFLSHQTPGTKVDVFRPKKFLHLSTKKQKKLNTAMTNLFNQKFLGAPFDALYLWNNFDSQGRELLYCSEFIAKFMDHFLDSATVPTPISYEKNKDYWLKYFHGQIPENPIGNSPVSFSTDPRYTFVGSF